MAPRRLPPDLVSSPPRRSRRSSAADRARLQRALQAATAPRRADGMGPEHRSPAETGPAPAVLRQAHTTDRVVSLTFDDGPHPFVTPRILETLRRENIPATFFL